MHLTTAPHLPNPAILLVTTSCCWTLLPALLPATLDAASLTQRRAAGNDGSRAITWDIQDGHAVPQTREYQLDDLDPDRGHRGHHHSHNRRRKQQHHHHNQQQHEERQREQEQREERTGVRGGRRNQLMDNSDVTPHFLSDLAMDDPTLTSTDPRPSHVISDTQTGREDWSDEEEEERWEEREHEEEEEGGGGDGESRYHGRLTPCPGCQRITDVTGTSHQQLSEVEMKERIIERIKEQILRKLRLETAPNVTRRHVRLPEPLARADVMLGDQADVSHDVTSTLDDPDDFYGRTTQLVKFAVPVPACPGGGNTQCFFFDLDDTVDASEVASVELWLYKERQEDHRRPHTLVFSKLVGQHQNASRLGKEVGHTVVNKAEGWVKVDVRRLATRWLSNPSRNVGLAVSCKTCHINGDPAVASDGDRLPFLVIHTQANHRVYRRSLNDCSATTGNRCCREKFLVDFREIGWDWVTWPPNYWANYCKGTCFVASPINPKYQHTNIMQKVAVMKDKEELAPCCAPRRMSALSLLYSLEGNGGFVRQHLPNMVVESCGCT